MLRPSHPTGTSTRSTRSRIRDPWRPSAALPPVVAEGEPVVQLRYAPLPSLLRPIAVHHWFVVFEEAEEGCRRWEVWQTREAGGTCWGHVHRDLMHPDRGVGGGPPRIAAEWRGDAARGILAVLREPERYPHCERYRAWPGPNSNTYAAWVLRESGIDFCLDPRAIGKDYLGLLGGCRPRRRPGFQLESPLLGMRVERGRLELHLLCFTFGLRLKPLALETPLGRIGAGGQ